MMRPLLPLAALALLAAPVLAQDKPPTPHLRALAAGYKASFLCSNLFNAGLSEAQVEGDDLSLVYVEYRPILPTLTATVDREAKTVSVPFDDKLPPRIAAWRPHLGCAQLPTGADPANVAKLPRLTVEAPASVDAQAWPMGDAKAEAELPRAAAAKLKTTMAAAFDKKSYGEGSETTAVLVVKDGRIVGEQYRAGYDKHVSQRTWSAAKSLTATLIGAAAHQGLLDVKKPAPVPEWQAPGDPRAAITTENLLHMASGLYSEAAGNRTDDVYFGGTSVTERATGMPLEAKPGTRWLYANNDTLLAARALRHALGDGDRALAFPFTDVLWKIGMRRTFPETDWQGNYILSSQVWTTARDVARLGLLYQNDGVWNGERLLPQGWAKYVATPAPAQPTGRAGGEGYGAQFWLMGGIVGLPADSYSMQGNRGQIVVIIPSEKLIVVRRGFDAVGPGGGRFEAAKFVAAVREAIK
ncbi:serine hydrolase domain-containing protein [Sphingoaurantiacus capsulatus]|uniref:Serine hydrolase domain-containing protein n=1 Tax=Sphingoaurantiacus capsulatus TaxID=1771310 RepID=A0ABV7X4N6_9SPHN